MILVGTGDYAVARSPVKLKASGLGSCVGITLYDRETKVGGLIHVMLPSIKEACLKANPASNPAKFADSGIEHLLEEVVKIGACRKRLEAKVVGGASMFSTTHLNIGERNTKLAKKTLEELGVAIVAEDTGKNYGRTITFDISTGDLLVKTVLEGNKII
nr:chemotaxis protein CheD [Methanosarcina sp. KYL-1]